MTETEPTTEFQPYHYNPSLAAAAISVVLFLITALVHVWQILSIGPGSL
jgi:hypothetical protein